MAIRLNAGDDWSRKDMFHINPEQIKVVEDLRGRVKPPTEAAIIAMAESLMDNGQQQLVQVRKIEQNKLQLVLGFTRCAAARLIREGFTDSQGQHRQDADFKIQCKLVDVNDETALINNIVENAVRNATNAIDDAHNQNKLRERYGKSDADIARIYGYPNANKVGTYRRLLALSAEQQDMVADGRLPVKGALELLDLPADKRDEAISAAIVPETGKVQATAVTAQVREHILADAADKQTGDDGEGVTSSKQAAAQPRYKALTLKEVRSFLTKMKDEGDTPAIKALGKAFLEYVAGKKGEKWMTDQFNKAAGGGSALPTPKKTA